jgi:hypothetical protein
MKTLKQMGKQNTLRRKRNSYMSQGYLIKRIDHKDYSICSKNQSMNGNDELNNEISSVTNNRIIENNNSNFVLIKDAREKEIKEGILRHDSKNVGDNSRRLKKKKQKNQLIGMGTPIFEEGEIPQLNIKKLEVNKGRHKSVNFGDQRGDNFIASGWLGLKNMNMNYVKNSSENVNINDSSKQMFITNKSPFQIQYNKLQSDKFKFDETSKRPSIIYNNEINNNTNNLNTIIHNSNTEAVSSYLKAIIQRKIKLINPEGKQDHNLLNQIDKKPKYFEYIKFFFLCNRRKENIINLIYNFRKKLLSEEHLYKTYIDLYLLEKIFQIDNQCKFDPNELYNNL